MIRWQLLGSSMIKIDLFKIVCRGTEIFHRSNQINHVQTFYSSEYISFILIKYFSWIDM